MAGLVGRSSASFFPPHTPPHEPRWAPCLTPRPSPKVATQGPANARGPTPPTTSTTATHAPDEQAGAAEAARGAAAFGALGLANALLVDVALTAPPAPLLAAQLLLACGCMGRRLGEQCMRPGHAQHSTGPWPTALCRCDAPSPGPCTQLLACPYAPSCTHMCTSSIQPAAAQRRRPPPHSPPRHSRQKWQVMPAVES